MERPSGSEAKEKEKEETDAPPPAPTAVASYVPLRDALAAKWSSMGNGREGGLRRVNKAAGAFLLCAAFETRTGRRPLAADLPELLDGIADAERDNGVKPGWLPPSVVEEHVGRELGAGSGHSASPAVAAIVGGVLGQEVRSIHWSPYYRVRVVNADP